MSESKRKVEHPVEYIKIKDLKLLEDNPRTISKKAFDRLKGKIERNPDFFEGRPCLLSNRTGEWVVFAGNQRLKAAEALGWKEVPCAKYAGLDEEREKELTIIDNVQEGDWDYDILANKFDPDDLDEWGIELDWEKEPTEVVEDKAPEVIDSEPADSVLGGVYQLGRHRLMCGDSTNTGSVAILMDGHKADMVFTDPPYNVGFNGRSGKFDVIRNDNLAEDEFDILIGKACTIIKSLEPKSVYIWCNWKFYGTLQKYIEPKACIVWAKNNFGMGKGYRHQHEFCMFYGDIDEDVRNETDLWQEDKDTKYEHPTQKPVVLCARALSNTKKAQNIVDLFGGSGSTLVACEQLGRTCYMMELDPKYCDVIRKRYWKFMTGSEEGWQDGTKAI